jgi:hypothetical protein
LVPQSASAATNPDAQAGVASLNSLRTAVGVPPVTHDPAQSAGCRQHAAYYARTGHIGHEELPGDPGYTTLGDNAAASSNLAYGVSPFTGAADWTDAVYHRIAMLYPRLADSGYWAEHGIACLGVLGTMRGPTVKQLTAYPYPTDGQLGLPVSFGCNERPNPCSAVKGASASRPPGSILSVQFDSPQDQVDASTVRSASLRADGEPKAVSVVVQDARDKISPYLRGGLAIIPRRPLKISTWYTARVSGTVSTSDYVDGAVRTPFAVTWRFQTGPVVLSAASFSIKTRCSPTRKGVTRTVRKCAAKKQARKKPKRR